MRRTVSRTITACLSLAIVGLTAPPAAADHTDPRTRLAPTTSVGGGEAAIERGDGNWRFFRNFRGGANDALIGGGTDLEFFQPAGSQNLFGAFGTLGQSQETAIGQRMIRLLNDGELAPKWVADHGSGHCEENTNATGLQHDTQVGKLNGVTLLTDTTDATGRCHDTDGGGIEIVDVTKLHRPRMFKPRETHLVRFPGYSHTNTIDGQHPWIVYSSAADFKDRNWIDVVNMRSCYGERGWTLAKRRSECRPNVFRIQLQPNWTKQRDQDTGKLEPGSATCHDITYSRQRLYCAALNSTLIIDVSDMFRANGSVKGTALSCPVVAGDRTGAKVTDCSQRETTTAFAEGWRFLGTHQHPGRDCIVGPGADARNCNSNVDVRSDEGVSVSHEADPTPDRQFMFVTDERGGGVVPPGSSCAPGIENPYGNGGAHAFDISNPGNIQHARTPGGAKAVYISDAVIPAETFCDVHVIEQVPGEQRFIAAYYTQGIKIVDYFVTDSGRIAFREKASYTLPDANTWSAEDFKIRRNPDGTRTYFIAANDIHRGIDVVSWTGRPNLPGANLPRTESTTALTNAGLVGFSALTLLAAAGYRRRRNRSIAD